MEEEKQIILEYVKRLFNEDDRADITDTTDLISEGYIDSFNMVVMQVMIEKTFKIKLKNITTEDFRTVDNMTKLIKR